MKKIMLDGLSVDLSDAAAVEAAVGKLQNSLADSAFKLATVENQVATLTATVSARDAEIVTLRQAVTDAKVTPAQLRDAAKAYDRLVMDAKRLLPSLVVADGMDEPAIRKAVVSAKVGDAAKDFTDAQVDVSFATLLAAGLPAPRDTVRDAISAGTVSLSDARAKRDEAVAKAASETTNAWRAPVVAEKGN